MYKFLILLLTRYVDCNDFDFSPVLSSLQCIHESSYVSEVHSSFNPRDRIQEYSNKEYIETLLNDISTKSLITNDEAFTNSPEHISNLSVILNALYFNTQDWWLLYNTTAWLVGKVNSAQLYWAIAIVANEKFNSVVPSVIDVFPQLFIAFKSNENDVVRHFTGDPGLNEFHTHWHIDNPFWWNESFYGSSRNRRGELFLYMHHQVLSRYNMERVNSGLEEAHVLNLTQNAYIPEPYYPDVLNINFESFPYRDQNTPLADGGNTSLANLQTFYERLFTAVQSKHFFSPNNSHVVLTTDLLGDTTESSDLKSANHDYYGSFHNYLHRLIAAIGVQENGKHIPGVQAHPETSMRDPVFYQIHSLVDTLYIGEKAKEMPYTQVDLDYPGIEIRSLSIQSRTNDMSWWPPLVPTLSTPTITTYFETVEYDVSTSERPCRSLTDPPVYIPFSRLNHVPFKYVIRIRNSFGVIMHGMLRIFLTPERDGNGNKYSLQDSYARAIELDRYHVELLPNIQTILTRSSTESSLTAVSQPSLKPTTNSTQPRNCGFPSNLLIPKGTIHGVQYKLVVMISKEVSNDSEYSNYPYCGVLNTTFPDARSMGFPFDRRGTVFKQSSGMYGWIGYGYKNVKITRIRVVHHDDI